MQQKNVVLHLTEDEAVVALQALQEWRMGYGAVVPVQRSEQDDEGEWSGAAPEPETPFSPGSHHQPDAPASQGALDGAIQLDRHGVPWNADLHSSSKKINTDGRWKMRQGGDKTKVEAWHAQHAGGNRHAQASQYQPATQPTHQAPPLPQPSGQASQNAQGWPPVDYGTFYVEFVRRHDSGWMTEPLLKEMMEASGARDTNDFAVNDNARSRAYAWMMQRAA